MRADPSRTVDWWSEARWLDLALPGAVVGVHLAVVERWSHGDILMWIPQAQRLGVYQTGAAAVSIFGGLSAIAISVYLAASGERAKAVRRHYPDELRITWRGLLVATGIAVALCLIAQTLDTAQDPRFTRFIFEYAMGLASLRFVRLVWLFNAIIGISDRDLLDKPRPPAPQLDEAWASKVAMS